MSPITIAVCITASAAVLACVVRGVHRSCERLAQAGEDADVQPLADELIREVEAAVEVAGLEHQLGLPDAERNTP